ncbi:MAG: hypothetical protein IKN54_06100 [Lachnospiraceae bacterium]|nr:hypothetical protein [Lachnospiraceae bacterium]
MKRIKKLTYNERKIVESWGLNVENWGREKVVDGYLILRNLTTSEVRKVPARVKSRC